MVVWGFIGYFSFVSLGSLCLGIKLFRGHSISWVPDTVHPFVPIAIAGFGLLIVVRTLVNLEYWKDDEHYTY